MSDRTIIVLIFAGIMSMVFIMHMSRPPPEHRAHRMVGGCAGTRHGCCSDGVTSSNKNGSNCPPEKNHHHHHHHHDRHMVGGCAGTRYGCCPGSSVARADRNGTNC